MISKLYWYCIRECAVANTSSPNNIEVNRTWLTWSLSGKHFRRFLAVSTRSKNVENPYPTKKLVTCTRQRWLAKVWGILVNAEQILRYPVLSNKHEIWTYKRELYKCCSRVSRGRLLTLVDLKKTNVFTPDKAILVSLEARFKLPTSNRSAVKQAQEKFTSRKVMLYCVGNTRAF